MIYLLQRMPAAGLALALLVAGAAYLVVVVPRLPAAAAIAATVTACGLLVLAAWRLPAPANAAWAIGVGTAALAAGHLGWLLGHRVAAARSRGDVAEPATGVAQTAPGTEALPAPTGSLEALSRRSTDRIPVRLGRYSVERRLARGAMGAVYLATDPAIGRRVAIKTMALEREAAGREATEAKERFFREAEAAGRLQHPDIVSVYDVGEDQRVAYIAMELLEGSDLRPRCRSDNLLAVPRVLAIGARVADALAYAHKQGIVHRDVKPANLVVDPTGASVKITDFGVARLGDWSRTRTGVLLGTPNYMSPEQLLGQPLDGRADLYSLGVVLFELLTGRLPYQAESMSKLMQLIVNEPAPDVCSFRPQLPAILTPVLARALEKRPAARYADGREFAQALRRVAAGCGQGVDPPVA